MGVIVRKGLQSRRPAAACSACRTAGEAKCFPLHAQLPCYQQ
jgi:hypothetical protein